MTPAADPTTADGPADSDAAFARMLATAAAAVDPSTGGTPPSALGDDELEAPIEFRGPDAVPSIDGYDLTAFVGRGGQGVVYRATEQATGRDVAIKVLPGGHFADPRARSRFAREARILARLRCPGVVTAVGHGRTADGSPYLVLPYVDGPALDEHAAGLPDAALALLFAAVADVVHAVHAEGVVHRDLKPSNVRVGPDGRPRLLDFGLADSGVAGDVTRSLTAPGQVLGTLAWASPEQARGDVAAVDARSDVYALGVMLCRAVAAGHAPPYDTGGTPRDVVRQILRARPAVAGRRAGDPLAAVALRCLAKRQADRYPTAAALAADLRRAAAGLRPAGAGRRWLRRRWFVPAGIVALMGVATAAVTRPRPGVVGQGGGGLPGTRAAERTQHDRTGGEFAKITLETGSELWVSTGEVTSSALCRVLGDGPTGDGSPAVATFNEADRYCRSLSVGKDRYRLPTAAELGLLARGRPAATDRLRGQPDVEREWCAPAPPPGPDRRPFRLIFKPRQPGPENPREIRPPSLLNG